MSDGREQLYELLPVVYRQRDAEQGWPLRALLQVIAEQVEVVKKDIDGLYENWFIETCQDWVVPYLGDLVGYEPVYEAGQPGDATEQGIQRNKILTPRAEVANTIRNRRRKGTLALLELLAQDVANWPTRAVEFFKLLCWFQSLNHQHLDRGRTANIRDSEAMRRIGGPFDVIAHTIDVRRPNSHRTVGRYNIPSIGLFVWRLRTYSITRQPVYYVETSRQHCYTFSVFAHEMPLYTRAVAEPDPTQIAGPENLPVPILIDSLREVIKDANNVEHIIASAKYYGADKSLAIWAEDWPKPGAPQPIPREAVMPMSLAEWEKEIELEADRVAVDPELGRLYFPPDQLPPKGVSVLYHYGFPAELGGGEYDRPIIEPSAHALSLSLFRLVDFKSGKRVALVLKFKKPEKPGGTYDEEKDTRDAVSRYIYEQFSSETQIKFENYDDFTKEPDDDLLDALADELTALIQAGPLYEKKRFTQFLPLPDELQKLINRKPEGPELIRLNRLLLEFVYADKIAKSYGFYRVGMKTNYFPTIGGALQQWQSEQPRHAVIEVADSGVYTEKEPITINFSANQSLQIRAALGTRPALRLLDYKFSGPDALTVTGAPKCRLILDGLLIFGRGVLVEKELAEINIRHCTLVPGWDLEPNCKPKKPEEISLRLVDSKTRLTITHSILGTIEVVQSQVTTDPINIMMCDSILDATADNLEALGGPGGKMAHAVLTAKRCTVIGKVFTHAIALAENSIFASVVQVARRQEGCMRFCYVPPFFEEKIKDETIREDSRTPRRFNCQPDLAERAVSEKFNADETSQQETAVEQEQIRIKPEFTSTRYGTAAYCQLALTCAEEIKRGADDESEMGAYHDLFQPQREANLRTRLDEYTPAGMNAGIFFVS